MRLTPPRSIEKIDCNIPTQPNLPQKRRLELIFIDHLVGGGGSHLYEIGISLNDLDLKEKALSSFPDINDAFSLLGEMAQHFEASKEIELTSGEIYCYRHLIQAFGGKRPLLEILRQKEERLSFFLSLIEALRLPKQGVIPENKLTDHLPLPDPSPLTFKDHLISADIEKIASPKIKRESLERSSKVSATSRENRFFKVFI